MANRRISSLSSLGGTPNTADIIPITDVSDTTGSAQGTTKKVTVANLVAAAPQGDLLAANNLSDVANAGTSRTNLGLGTAATTASTDYASAFYNIVTKTTHYTLTNAENGKVIFCNSSGLIDITVPSGLTSGFNCRVVQGGAGRVRFLTSGTTINGYTSGSNAPNAVIGQHGVADLVPTGTNIYSLHGDINYLLVYSNVNSVNFDGTNDYFDPSSAISFTGVYTLSMWFKQTTNALGILAFGGSAYIEPSGSNGRVLVSGYSGGIHSATNSYTFGQWSHFMIARNSSNAVEAWVNGVSAGTGTNSGTATFSKFGIYGTSVQPFGGDLDEISLFDSDQSANIATIYNSGVPTDLTSLSPVNWYRMGDNDGATGTTITDLGSGSNNGTLINGPTFTTNVPS